MFRYNRSYASSRKLIFFSFFLTPALSFFFFRIHLLLLSLNRLDTPAFDLAVCVEEIEKAKLANAFLKWTLSNLQSLGIEYQRGENGLRGEAKKMNLIDVAARFHK